MYLLYSNRLLNDCKDGILKALRGRDKSMRWTGCVRNIRRNSFRLLNSVATGLGLALCAHAQIPAVSPLGVVNAATGVSASSVPVAARGELIEIFGTNLAETPLAAASAPLNTKLGASETQVWFGDVAAPLLFISPNQINALVPYELPDVSVVDLRVQTQHGTSAPIRVTILTQDPGIFSVVRAGERVTTSNPVFPGDS